jgi:hypothetical protein
MALAQRRQVVNLLAGGVLAAVLGLIAVGLPALDRVLPTQRPLPGDEPYRVGAGVTVRPPDGALLDVTATRPGPDRGTALFLLGSVRYAVTVSPYDGDARTAVERLRQRITRTPGYQVIGGEQAISTGAGVPGLQGGYTAPGRGGRYAAFVAGGSVVEVTVSGGTVELAQALAAIEMTTRSIRYGAAG